MFNLNALLFSKEEPLLTLRDVFKRLVALDIYFDIKNNRNKFKHEFFVKNLNHNFTSSFLYSSFNNCLNTTRLSKACSNNPTSVSEAVPSKETDEGADVNEPEPERVATAASGIRESVSNIGETLGRAASKQNQGDDNSVFSNDNAFTELSSNLSSNMSNMDEIMNELNEDEECFLLYILHDLFPTSLVRGFAKQVAEGFNELMAQLAPPAPQGYSPNNAVDGFSGQGPHGGLNQQESEVQSRCMDLVHNYFSSLQSALLQHVLAGKTRLVSEYNRALNNVKGQNPNPLVQGFNGLRESLAETRLEFESCLQECGEDGFNGILFGGVLEELRQFFRDLNNVLISLYESKINLNEVYYLINYYKLDLDNLYVNVSTVEYALRIDERVRNYFNINESNMDPFISKLRNGGSRFNFLQFQELFQPQNFVGYLHNPECSESRTPGDKQTQSARFDKKSLISNLVYQNVYGIGNDSSLTLGGLYHLEPIPITF